MAFTRYILGVGAYLAAVLELKTIEGCPTEGLGVRVKGVAIRGEGCQTEGAQTSHRKLYCTAVR